jgi:autotransporter translocation and assembly factor TamB
VQGSVIRANVPTDLTRANPSVGQPVDATAESLAQAAREEEARGHIIRIAVQSDHARIEDLLTLGVRTTPPLMDGAMTLRAHLTIPPGHVSVAQKMQVEGSFTIRDASFANAQWQDTMNKLSARASGDAEKAKRGDVETVRPSMSGDFSLASAVLDVSKLHFEMPGAAIDVAGKYSLDGNTFDFAGTASTTATASQMLTGWKSLLAKPFDKLLEKNGAGVEVPITISGTRSAPKFGVDRGKLIDQIKGRFKKGSSKDRNEEQPTQSEPGSDAPAPPPMPK